MTDSGHIVFDPNYQRCFSALVNPQRTGWALLRAVEIWFPACCFPLTDLSQVLMTWMYLICYETNLLKMRHPNCYLC